MGIGTTVKNMLGSDNASHDGERDERGLSQSASSVERDRDPERTTNIPRTSKLPAGTGPGTSGKPASSAATEAHNFGQRAPEVAMQQDSQNAEGKHSIAGYGTDAAAAAGGTLEEAHQVRIPGGSSGAKKSRSWSGSSAGQPSGSKRTNNASNLTRDTLDTSKASTSTTGPSGIRVSRTGDLGTVNERPTNENRRGGDSSSSSEVVRESTERDHEGGAGQAGVLSENHHFGHAKNNAKDTMPGDNADEDTSQLQPITHERIRHFETEEVARVKEVERHIHHIQHHTQPVVASEELVEQFRENSYPMTVVRETHANKVEDNTLFEGQVHQYHDTLTHGPKERTIIDKGVTVNEHIHHHVHHVIQPIIEKETIDRQRVMTTIPIHEITHEAPVVHQSQTHAPVPLEHFLQRGGTLHGAIPQEDISKKMLHGGQCAREVDGVAEKLERDLNLGKSGRGFDEPVEEEITTKKRHTSGTAPIVAPVRN